MSAIKTIIIRRFQSTWASILEKPATFAPTAHTHTLSEITDAGILAQLTEQSADPADPAEGRSTIWQSNGTGTGDDGDILIKVTAGGVTKIFTLVDFSEVV